MSFIMVDAKPPPSLFIVLWYGDKASYSFSVLQLETQVINHEYEALEQIQRVRVNQPDDRMVAFFREPQECPVVRWLFSPPTVDTADLYMVPDLGVDFHSEFSSAVNPPSGGYKFDFRTGECRPFKPPTASKPYGHIVNRRGGHLYFMAHPDWYYDTPDPVFECYDPDTNRWKALEPFPDHAVHLNRCTIRATAVLDDTILYNMGGCRIWAYNVPKDKWYIVHVEDDQCYCIVGEAVVLNNTHIYALTNPHHSAEDLILALSIQIEEKDHDLVYRCYLRSVITVPGMNQIRYKTLNAFNNTRHLVHLGEKNFCLVQSCNFQDNYELNIYQPIQLTSLKLTGGNSMIVTNICVYEVEIQPKNQFEVGLCFSLPECKTNALKQGKRFLFNLDPCRDAYVSKQEDKIYFNPEPGDGAVFESNTAEEGHFIFVKNLPPDANIIHLDGMLRTFGPVKRDGIRVIIDDTQGDCHFSACVEFESAASRRYAIEDSAFVIQGCLAEIEEMREDIPCRHGDAAYASKQKDKTDFNPEPEVKKPVHFPKKKKKPVQASTHGDGAASEKINTAEEARSISITKLPAGVTVRELHEKLKKFGPIPGSGIRIILDTTLRSCPIVCVEFESATSRQRAIKASRIKIQGYQVEIKEMGEDLASLYRGPEGSNVAAGPICVRFSNSDVDFGQIERGWMEYLKQRRFEIRFEIDTDTLLAIASVPARRNISSGPTGDQFHYTVTQRSKCTSKRQKKRQEAFPKDIEVLLRCLGLDVQIMEVLPL